MATPQELADVLLPSSFNDLIRWCSVRTAAATANPLVLGSLRGLPSPISKTLGFEVDLIWMRCVEPRVRVGHQPEDCEGVGIDDFHNRFWCEPTPSFS